MNFNKILNEIIDVSIVEFQKEKNRKRVETLIVSPLIEFILDKLKPYILGLSIFLVTIILLVICMIIQLLFKF